MANTLNVGNGNWATKEDSLLAYNSENGNFKPLPFDFTRASSATVVNKAGLIETVGSGEPRIDFKDDTKGALLLEPSRTNLITYSEAFDNSYWTKGFNIATTPIVTPNQSVSPNGNITSDKIVFPIVGSGFSIITRPITLTNTHYSQSIYLKGELGNETIWLMNTKDGVNYYEIECNLSTQWQRFNYSALLTSGFDNIQFGIDARSSTQSSNTIQTIYAWGAQLEEGSYATSYIPTQGSAVTRVADACNNGGNEQVINSTEGVLYVEISALTSIQSSTVMMSIGNESSNFIRIGYQQGANLFFAESTGTLNGIGIYSVSITSLINSKIALSYKENDVKLYINGVLAATDTVFTAFSSNTLNTIRFDSGSGSNIFNGNTKDIRVYNTALTDAELQALTSN